jgi:threonine dehydratase
MIARAKQIAEEENMYFTDQMRNKDMLAGYEPLAEEILHQLDYQPITAFTGALALPE